ncbi:MAG: hypothetical protein ACRC9X_02880 [Bacteroidales bacterium]
MTYISADVRALPINRGYRVVARYDVVVEQHVCYATPLFPFFTRHCGLDPQSPATECKQKEELPY